MTPPSDKLSPPPPPAVVGHHNAIHHILFSEQNKHIDTLRTISNLEIHQPGNQSRLTNFDRVRTQQDLLLIQQPELAMRELDQLSKKIDDAVAQARARERDSLQKKSNSPTPIDPNSIDYTKIDQKTIKNTLNQLKEIYPLLNPILNKKVTNKITSAYQHVSETELKATPTIAFQSKVESELERNWSSYFPEAEKRREVAAVITESIAAEAGNPHPERLPTEQLGRLLRDAVHNYSSHNTNINEELLFQESQSSAQELSLDAVIFQNNHRPNDAQEARRRFAATDPFYALKQNKSPLASAKSGIFRSFIRGRMVNTLVNSIDDNEINQRINSRDLSIAQKRALIRAQIYEGVYLWEAGVDSNRLNNMHSHISSISTRLGSIERDSDQLKKLASLQDERAYLAEVMQKNPKAVSRYLSIFANTNHAFKSASNLDRAGWRFKTPYLMHTFRDRKDAIIEPIASIIHKPFIAFDDFTYKYSPISWTQRKIGGKILSIRRHVGLALARKATTLAAKQGVKGLVGKLLIKSGLAIAGVSTGGLGTVIAIASILKDVINLIGLKRLLKRIGKIVATGLYLVWSLIKALMSLLSGALTGALIGAGIGFLIGGPIGAVIGGAVGGFIGGYMVVAGISVTAALTGGWAVITGAVTTAATALAGFLSTLATTSAAYLTTLTVSSFAFGLGSVAIGTMAAQNLTAEINTLRVSVTDVKTDIFNCDAADTPKPSNAGVIMSGNYAFPLINYTGMDACYHWGSAYWAVDIYTGHKGEGDPERHLPIVAYTSGVITQTKENDVLGGVYIIQKGDDGRYYYYAHQCVNYVQVGQRVSAGEVIAISNRQGLNATVTPEHLHFAIEEGVSSPDFTDGGNVCPYTDFREKFGIQACEPQYECVQNWNR